VLGGEPQNVYPRGTPTVHFVSEVFEVIVIGACGKLVPDEPLPTEVIFRTVVLEV